MSVHAWPTMRGPAECDFWVEPMQGSSGDQDTTSSGLIEVVDRFARVRASITWPIMRTAQACVIEAHLGRLRGRRHSTTVPNYKYKTKLGTATGAWVVSGAHARGAETLTIAGGSGAFAAGDWVEVEQVSGVPRAHIVVATQIGGSVEIAPPLHEALLSGKVIKHLGDGSTTVIRDTMMTQGDAGQASRFAGGADLVNKRTVEFISARRKSY